MTVFLHSYVTTLSSMFSARQNDYRILPNQELIAIGKLTSKFKIMF